MRLSNYLRKELVVFGLKAGTRDEVLSEVETHLVREGVLPSSSAVAEALRVREEAHTTALGDGVAVPHTTIPHLDEMLLLVAATTEPVPFGPPETDPADLFFVLLSPPGKEGSHIKLLARICRLVRHPGVLEEFRGARGRDELLEAILRVDSEHV